MSVSDNLSGITAAGIVAEYNPFHNGHAYQIQEVRRRSRAGFVAVVMSGDFVQRGAPALLDKYARAKMALLGGADLVLELPCAASCGSAARFAQEAVRILDGLRIVRELWFGSEAGDIRPLLAISRILAAEPEDFRERLQKYLREGKSYPLARHLALEEFLAGDGRDLSASCLKSPNNLLGIEYCAALERLNSSIRPRTLKRIGSGYHETGLAGCFGSASGIRRAVTAGRPAELERQMPPAVYAAFSEALQKEGFLEADDFSLLLKCRLLESQAESLLPFLPEDTARRAAALRNRFLSFTQFAELVKTRDRTRSSIDRSFLHLLLGIPSGAGTPSGAAFSASLPCRTLTDAGIVRVLGFRRRAVPLLSSVKRAGGLSMETRPAALPAEEYGTDLFASNFYEAVRSQKMAQPFREERTRQPVIL